MLKKKKVKKFVIFMIFLTKLVKEKYSPQETNEKEIKGKELISYLTNNNQIFIDNIIGENSFINILNKSIKE